MSSKHSEKNSSSIHSYSTNPVRNNRTYISGSSLSSSSHQFHRSSTGSGTMKSSIPKPDLDRNDDAAT